MSSTPATSPAKRPPRAHMVGHRREARAAFNRHELPAVTPDRVRRPRRRHSTGRSGRNHPCQLGPHANLDIHIEAVHRLTDLGAVVTHIAHGDSPEGFDAEWRMIILLTVDGDLIEPLRDLRRGRP